MTNYIYMNLQQISWTAPVMQTVTEYRSELDSAPSQSRSFAPLFRHQSRCSISPRIVPVGCCLKNRIAILITVFCLFHLGISIETQAQNNLWQRRDPAFVNPYADVKARRPGDLIIVQINERSNVQNRDQRLLQKNNKSSSKAGIGGGLTDLLGDSGGDLNFDQSSDASRQLNGNTQFRSERGFIDQFTVSVIDINTNGNLLISGTRQVDVEGDSRKLVLTGIIRAADVTRNNTILSSQIANLAIGYEAEEDEGAERRFLNHGWLGKKLNKWWPH